MAEKTIPWCDYTFNGWIGCTNVSPGCDNCYAEMIAKRFGLAEWGPHAERKLAGPAYWEKPIAWNRKAAKAGRPALVFSASMSDVFDKKAPATARPMLWSLIRKTPNLIWLILTKLPQNIPAELPSDWGEGYPNVMLMTSVENQVEANRRIPKLLEVPARGYGLSIEPLLEPVIIAQWAEKIDWAIVGGESGANSRPFSVDWARRLKVVCHHHSVAFFMKQMGSNPVALRLRHSKGDDPDEWPADLRVREFPAWFKREIGVQGALL